MITLVSQQLWIGLGIVGFLFVSLTMILIVLIQKPQGGGLSGAFGSSSDGGSGQTAFGAKTGDVLTTLTITIFVIFLLSAAGLNYMVRPPSLVDAQPEAASTGIDTTPVPAQNEAAQTPATDNDPASGSDVGDDASRPPSDSPPAPQTDEPDLDMPGDDSNTEG